MPHPRRPSPDAADGLIAVAPLVSRWIERLLAGHSPPLTVAQFLALRAIATEQVSASELARRIGVSPPAVSQLLAGLADVGLIERRELDEDRRQHTLTLSRGGARALASAHTLLHDRLSGLLGDFPRPEATALARALSRVDATLSGAPPPRRPAPPRPSPPRPPRPRRPPGTG